MRPRSAAKRAAVDKTALQAFEQIPVDRLGSVPVNGDGFARGMALAVSYAEIAHRFYASKENLTSTDLDQFGKHTRRVAESMKALAEAAAEAPIMADGPGAPKVIEGEELLALDFTVFKKVEGTS